VEKKKKTKVNEIETCGMITGSCMSELANKR